MVSQKLEQESYEAACEILNIAKCKKGQLLVVGCSTSEVIGGKIGTMSSPEAAEAVFTGIYRAVPQPKAGGSFATTAYQAFSQPVAVEHIKAHAGMDIGDTLIGMHLKDVAVPVRISRKTIGEAHVVCARTRAKFIGGSRAIYAEDKL